MNNEYKDITDKLKHYDLNFTCYTIYKGINYAVYKFKNTHNYFAFSPSFNAKGFYHFKGLTDKTLSLKIYIVAAKHIRKLLKI